MFRCCVPYFCSSPLIGLYLLCTPRTPHRARSSFFLNKGKGIGSPRPLSGAEGSTSPHLPRRPMGESFWGERQRRWGDDNAPQGEYPEGVSPSGRFFGDFLIGEKVTRGGGAERPPLGGCGGKRPPLGECRGAKPRVRRECRGGPAPSQKSPRSPGSYKFPEDSVSIKENNSSTSSRFKSRRWCLCLPSE